LINFFYRIFKSKLDLFKLNAKVQENVDCKKCKEPREYVRFFSEKIFELFKNRYIGYIRQSKNPNVLKIIFSCSHYYHSKNTSRCQSKCLVTIDLTQKIGKIFKGKVFKHNHLTHNATIESQQVRLIRKRRRKAETKPPSKAKFPLGRQSYSKVTIINSRISYIPSMAKNKINLY
jgi:hypothetical protein